MDQIRELEKETQQLLALKMMRNDADDRSVTNEDDDDDEDEDDNENEESENQSRSDHNRLRRTSDVKPIGKGEKSNIRPGPTGTAVTATSDDLLGTTTSSRLADRFESHRRKSRSNSQTTILQTPGKLPKRIRAHLSHCETVLL